MTQVFTSIAITDKLVGEGVNLRSPVRVATVNSGTLASDFENGDSIDGITLSTGDRILIKNQVSAAENGTYIVQATGSPVRDFDLEDTASAANLLIWIQEGTVNENTGWIGSGTIGTDASFSRYDLNGTLEVSRGGTGGVTFTANAILVGNGTGAISEITPAANSVLVTDGSNIPSLETTLPASLTIPIPTISGDITFDEATNNLTLSVTDQTTGISTLTIPDLAGTTDTLVTENLTQTLTNKSLIDASTTFVDSVDPSITLSFDLDGTTSTSTTLTTSQTANRSIAFPDASGTLALLSDITGLNIKDAVMLGTTVDLSSNPSISGSATYNNVGGISGRGQITATLAVSDTFTVDGVSLGSADNGARLLLKDQTGGDENGIWTTTISGTSLTLDRATDFDQDSEVTANAFTFISEGSTLADTGWVLTTNNPIIIGGPSGTVLTWAQFSSQGEILAGDGLTKTGNTIDVVGSTNSIQVNANNIQVKSSATANEVLLSSGTITTEPSWGALPLNNVNSVTGILDEVNGGTGQSTYTTGDILYASAANTLSKLTVANNSVLTTNNAGAIDWRNNAHITNILDPANPTLETLILTGVASAVNEITITNSITGVDPSVTASGDDTNIGIDIITKGSGVITFATDSAATVAEIRLSDNTGGEYVGIDVPATVTSYTLTLPDAVGSAGQVLQLADGSGNLEFATSIAVRDFHIEDAQIQFSTTSFVSFSYFAWDDSDVGGVTTRTLTFYYISTDRLGELQIYNETTTSAIDTFTAGTDFTDTTGIKTVTFTDIGSDALVSFRARKTAINGTNPRMFGLRLMLS